MSYQVTMIEKVARALDPSLWRGMDDGMSMPVARQMSLDAARRAIEAMRAPSDRMISEGESAASIGIGKPRDGAALPRVWASMIDAALNEDEK